MSAHGDYKKALLPSAAFLGITAAVYYPVVVNIKRYVNGSLDDAYTILWLLWWVKRSILDPDSSLAFSPFVESPFGVRVTHSTFVNHLAALPFSWALGPVGSYNSMILLSFFLTALGMYLLVCEVTECRGAAFFSGLAFSFSPYHTSFSATGGMDASQMQYMPFTLFFLIRYGKSGALKDLFLFLIFLLLSVFSFGYYGAIIFVAVASYLSCSKVIPFARGILKNGAGADLKTVLVWSGASYIVFVLACNTFEGLALPVRAAVYLLPVAAVLRLATGDGAGKSIASELRERFGASDPRHKYLIAGGAAFLILLITVFLMPVFRPATREISSSYFAPAYSYFAPAPDHALLGRFLPSFFIPSPDPVVGKMVHVGLVLTALIVFASVKTLRNPLKDITRESFLFMFLAGVALALPPEIKFGGFSFWGPVYFFHALVPPFVDIRRVVVLILLSGCVLAGYGIKEILRSIDKRPLKGLVYGLLVALLAVEFYPSLSVKDLSRLPGAYGWLKDKRGDFTIIEYPLTSIYDSKRNEPFFGQTVHGKRLVNPFGAVGHDPRAGNPFLMSIIDKGGPANELYSNTEAAASILAYMGVRYVVLRTDKVTDGIPVDTGDWLKAAACYPDSMVFEVTSKPAAAFLTFKDFFRNGFFLNYSEKTADGYAIRNPYYRPKEAVLDNKAWLWMGKNASIKITALKNEEAAYGIRFTARSFEKTAELSVKDKGVEIFRASVTKEPREFLIKGVVLKPLEVKALELTVTNDEALRGVKGFLDPRAKDEPVSYIGIGIRGAVIKEEEKKDKPAGLLRAGMLDGLYGGGRI